MGCRGCCCFSGAFEGLEQNIILYDILYNTYNTYKHSIINLVKSNIITIQFNIVKFSWSTSTWVRSFMAQGSLPSCLSDGNVLSTGTALRGRRCVDRGQGDM